MPLTTNPERDWHPCSKRWDGKKQLLKTYFIVQKDKRIRHKLKQLRQSSPNKTVLSSLINSQANEF